MKLNMKFACAILAFGFVGMSQPALAEQRDLNKDEIMAKFSDKTVSGHHATNDMKSITYFAADGTFKGKRLDKEGITEGKWTADDKNLLCRGKEGNRNCRRVVDDNGTIKIYNEKDHVWTYTKFENGNKL